MPQAVPSLFQVRLRSSQSSPGKDRSLPTARPPQHAIRSKMRASSSFVMPDERLDARRVNDRRLVRLGLEPRPGRPTRLATTRSACLAVELVRRVLDDLIGLGGEQHEGLAPLLAAELGGDVARRLEVDGLRAAFAFFTFSSATLSRTPVGNSGVEDGDVGVLEPLDARGDTSPRPSRRGRRAHPAGVSTDVGPADRPSRRRRAGDASRASAKPMRPVERFEMKRTGSIASRVGPTVYEDAHTAPDPSA